MDNYNLYVDKYMKKTDSFEEFITSPMQHCLPSGQQQSDTRLSSGQTSADVFQTS